MRPAGGRVVTSLALKQEVGDSGWPLPDLVDLVDGGLVVLLDAAELQSAGVDHGAARANTLARGFCANIQGRLVLSGRAAGGIGCLAGISPPARGMALIQQGISTRLKGLSGPSDMAWVRIHARPGTVNFTLPDRDAIIEDAAYRNLVTEVQQALVQAVIGRIFQFGDDKARRRLANLVYAWNPLRVIELPPDLQHVQLRQDRDYLYTLTRQQVAERLAKGTLACAFEPQYHTAFELVPNEMLQLASGQAPLFKAMFPDVPLITEIRFGVTADDRSDLLWRCERVTYRFDTGETREVQPVPEQTVLADGDLEGEFVPDDRADCRSGNDFAVVHSCADAVAYPNLDPWHAWHEEELDHEQTDELWRTSDIAVHIAATWPGVPANDVTPDELVTLLRDRLADGKQCRLRFANAKFELGWGNQLSIRSMLVEVVENGKVTRKVRLVENCGYLQEVTP